MAWRVTWQFEGEAEPQHETYGTRVAAEFARVAWEQAAIHEGRRFIVEPSVTDQSCM